MAEPVEYRRILVKVDTLAGWNANPLILGDGEWATVRNNGVVINYRIGDGTKRFSELPNIIQYDQAAYVAPNGSTLPVPQNGVGYSILTAGSYNGGAIVVPANNLGVAEYVGNAWVVRNMELPIQQLNVQGGALGYDLWKESGESNIKALKEQAGIGSGQVNTKRLKRSILDLSPISYIVDFTEKEVVSGSNWNIGSDIDSGYSLDQRDQQRPSLRVQGSVTGNFFSSSFGSSTYNSENGFTVTGIFDARGNANGSISTLFSCNSGLGTGNIVELVVKATTNIRGTVIYTPALSIRTGSQQIIDLTANKSMLRTMPYQITMYLNLRKGEVIIYMDGEIVLDRKFTPVSFTNLVTSSWSRTQFVSGTGNPATNRQNSGFYEHLAIFNKKLSELDVEYITQSFIGDIINLEYPKTLHIAEGKVNQNFYKQRVYIPHDTPLALGVIVDRTSQSTQSGTALVMGDIDDSDSAVVRPNDLFGTYSGAKYYHGGTQREKIYPSGFRTLSYRIPEAQTGLTVRGWSATIGERGAKFIGNVKDGYSYPLACVHKGIYYSGNAAIFSDTRYLELRDENGLVNQVKMCDGLTILDVNHAGVSVLKTTNGILIVNTAHSQVGRLMYVTYLPDGDIERRVDYTIGGVGAAYAYPQMVMLNSGKVALYVRGNNSGIGGANSQRDSALLYIFNPEDGSGLTQDVLYSSNLVRAYNAVMELGTGANGKEYLVFVGNPRYWASDQHETGVIYGYNVTDDVCILPSGEVVGTAGAKGTISSPRIPFSTINSPIENGGCRFLTRDDFNSVEIDVQAPIVNFQSLPSKIEIWSPYQLRNGESAGGFGETFVRHIFVSGNVKTDLGAIELPFGNSVGAFSGQVTTRLNNGDYVTNIFPRYSMLPTGTGDEITSPYWDAWKGGEQMASFTINNPFSETASLSMRYYRQVNKLPIANCRVFPQNPQYIVGYLNFQKAHPTIGRCEIRYIDVLNGVIGDTPFNTELMDQIR